MNECLDNGQKHSMHFLTGGIRVEVLVHQGRAMSASPDETDPRGKGYVFSTALLRSVKSPGEGVYG